MPRQNITDLTLPDHQFRPDKCPTSGFERLDAALAEGRIRAEMLRKYAACPISSRKRRAAQQLAKALLDDSATPSLASAVYIRDFRVRVTGHLWRICELESHAPSTFTVWGRGMEIAGKGLSKLDPNAFARAFRADLYRGGAKGSGGYIFAFLDAEFNPAEDVWKFHWHGLADGELKGVLDQLRNSRKYGRPKDIRISRKPLTNLPEPLTYLIKPFWGSRWHGLIGEKICRQRWRSRIAEPRHSELLLWLNQWSPADLSVLVGFEVVGHHLVKNHEK